MTGNHLCEPDPGTRFLFRQEMRAGCSRLINILCIFLFIISGLYIAGSSAEANGIRLNIQNSFDLTTGIGGNAARTVRNKEEVKFSLMTFYTQDSLMASQDSLMTYCTQDGLMTSQDSLMVLYARWPVDIRR
jgi:hypothetical protein